MSGKGDAPRAVDGERYRAEWDRIFGPDARVPRRLTPAQADALRGFTTVSPEYALFKTGWDTPYDYSGNVIGTEDA